MALTALKVRTEKRKGRYSDGGGLYLFVQVNEGTGAIRRSWVLRVQAKGLRSGARYDIGLGGVLFEPVPDLADTPLEQRSALTLAEAREKARRGRELAKSGVWPPDVWNAVSEVIPTFEEAAREYHAAAKKGWRDGKHSGQWLNTLTAYAFPKLGNKPVNDIDAADAYDALLPIWLTIPETARRVRQRILAVLDYAHGKGWRELEAPARALQKLLKGIKQPRAENFAAMPYADVPAFVARIRENESVGKLALEFLILTAARSGEVRQATWSEVDLEAAEWLVPEHHAKAGRPHLVPLTPAAVGILERMRGLFSHKPDELIFPGMKGKRMSDATLAKALRVNGGGDYTVHGFRSSFRDWAANTGFADAWAEAALAHKNPDKVVAAYRRTVHFEQRRDKLMPAWASFVAGDRSNIIKLAEQAA